MKRLEDEGIGRPSTYASIISTILRRGYVFRQGKALVPSFTAFAVTELLRKHFDDYIDLGFTAEMEEDLDEVAEGKRESNDFIRGFYRGSAERPGLESRVRNDDQISYPAVDVGVDPEAGQPLRVRIGRYGPFVQRGDGGAGNTASLPDEVAPADFTIEQAIDLLKAKAEGPRVLGPDPATGQTVYLMSGRFGAYVQLGETPEKGTRAAKPKRASLPSNQTEATITLDAALRLLDLPREVGRHPDDGEPIVANFGRFGPYVKHGDEFRSLESEAEVFEVTLERAVELFKQPKRSRKQKAARTVLHQLGAHPDSGAAVQLLAGRYGPVRDRRQDQRVAAEDRRSGEVHAAGGGGAPQGARRGRSVEASGAQACRRRRQTQGVVSCPAPPFASSARDLPAARRRGRRPRAACTSGCTRCVRCVRRSCTRPTSWRSWSAATPSAATSWTTPSVC